MSTTPTHIARYTVVQPIAAGGMGEVFLARDDRLDRLVAIKLLRDGFDSEELRGRFEEEARNVAKLTHPNIVTIYEYGAHEGRPYIAMEYVAGHSLADLIRGKMPLPLARRVRLIEELCSGLSHAHKAHLVHRDVKPANLMVTTSGMLKVLDFGIAKLRGSDRTQAGMLVGTVNYMSPEQITGQPVDHRSDIFAVGLVLHEVLTYDQAFKGDLTSAMFNIVHGQPEALVVRCPGLDPGFQAVVNRCLAKRPEDRYHDLNLLKRDLARLRKPLEDDDTELADTIGLLNDDKTAVVPRTAPSTATQVKTAAGPDTRRALASAVAAGEAAIARGQFESAARHAEQALALEAGDAAARDLLDRARRAIDAAKAASHVGHAREALQADRLEDARTALMTAAQLAPESSTVRDLAAQVERRAADLARFDKAVRDAREHLGEGDFDGARTLAETAVLIRPDDSDIQRLRTQIDEAAAAEARRIEAATREADRLAQEAERVAQEQIEADAERVAQEQRQAEAERVEREQRQAEAARLERVAREAEAERVERERRQAETARLERVAEAQRVEHERRQADAAMDAAGAAVIAATPDASRDAVTLAQRAYWDEPTQTLEVLDARAPKDVPSPTPARQRKADDTRTQPAARPAGRPAAATRPVLMAIGGAAAVAVAVLVWAMRPASAPDPPPDTPQVVAPSDAVAPTAESPLAATPRGDAGALAGFQRPLESRPAGVEPAVMPTPGGVARPAAPAPSTVTPGPGAGGTGSGGTSRPGAVIPPATGAVPRPNTPPVIAPPVSAAPPVSVTPAGASATATPAGGSGTNPSGGTTPATAPPIPTTTSVSPSPSPAGSASASPATPPGGKAAAPSPVEAPVGRQLDESTIKRLVNAFGQAYQSKDLPGLKAVWPEMRGSDENSYRNVFNSYRSISWVTGDTNIRFEGERADARSAVQVTQRALRPDTTTTQSRTYRFQFERRAKGWVLTGVENLGVAR